MWKAKFAALLRELPPKFGEIGRIRIIRAGGCMSLDCTECHEFVSVRRGKRIKERLDVARQGGPIGESTFTIPPRLRGRFLDPKLFRIARRAAFKILKQIAGAKCGVACAHPIGDKNPDVFHPHVHFLWTTGEGFRGYLAPEIIERIRASWAEFLGVEIVDVHHSYVQGDEDGRIFHRCKYVARSFPGFAKWCGSAAWFGDYPRKVERSSDRLCRSCQKPVRVIGNASRKLFEIYRETGEAPIPLFLLSLAWTGEIPRPRSRGPG